MCKSLHSIRVFLDPSCLYAYDTRCSPYNFQNIPVQREQGNKLNRASLQLLEQDPQYSDIRTYVTTIEGCEAHPSLTVRIYEPVFTEKPVPAVLFLHGGGCIFGCCDSHPDYGFRFAKHIGCQVIVPEYRLAPEHPFPAGLLDCYAALKWMDRSPGIDSTRIAVCGLSGGGCLCAALALYVRDHGGPRIRLQLPLYPMLDHRGTDSSRYIQDPKVWCDQYNQETWRLYLGSDEANVNQYASPALAEDLSGLPAAFTFIGTLDPFLDETTAYFHKLATSGVPAEIQCYPNCFHGFELTCPETDAAQQAIHRTLAVLSEAFAI